ncbi:T9SS type A sorting domain-containing protein [Flavivirga abyssicola]|uniref:T9SS type A sorting domain-containing protein n=1 Tax=Flavivirga abyssicola TaxID=3063533 RepID=UPI0026DEFF37|nr:T9SS type A sorting domain-containing protein [Flavivirga sp. MEBiC07777]WVK13990.1 T9SS type A sorting domain-containing protein [Flavivirga sp. MEBiC07777]
MMKKLLKNIFILVAIFGAYTFSNAQKINVAVTSGPTEIQTDGIMNAPMVITVSNIPMGLDGNGNVAINSRVYIDGNDLLAGNHLAHFAGADFTFFDTTADVDTATLKTETTLNSPNTGFFTRVYTIKQYSAITATVGDILDFSLRVINHDSPTPELAFDPAQETGGQANRAILRISQDVEVVSQITLSTSDVADNISDKIYPNPVSTVMTISKNVKTKTYKVVNIVGSTVKEVEASGSMDVSDLSGGVYFLVTDSGIAKFVKK